MENRLNQRLERITDTTLIVGIDIAKQVQWARFTDYRGMEQGKAISFKNDRAGFENIVARIELLRKSKVIRKPFDNVIIGMGPTGHYWKPLAHYLSKAGYMVGG